MKVEERIIAFHSLGAFLEGLGEDEFQTLSEAVRNENPWFTEGNIRMAVSSVRQLLQSTLLQKWTSSYKMDNASKKIAVVMAGNIPLVGFHDLLSILISGHSILIKCSSKDSVLIKFLIDKLTEIEPRFKTKIEYGEQLKGFDAIIATGSDNASRYFEYYFSKYPHIIRKNRTSVGILHGNETEDEIKALGTDIFSYFGLGCRNVSKLFIPSEFPPQTLLKIWEPFHDIIHHHKYCNNYDYQKSILLVTRAPFLDNGFVLLQQDQRIVSPIAVIYYEFYKDRKELNEPLTRIEDKIQCIVENTAESKLKFGQAQFPALSDYADQIDTLKFLTELN